MQTSHNDRLTRSLSRVPVTGLALCRAPSGRLFALAGVDADVLVYDAGAGAEARDPLCCVEVFEGQPVHGIQVQGHTVLVWGARDVALFSMESLFRSEDEGGSCAAPLVARATAPDWICDVAISPLDPHVAMLATAHNEVVPMRSSPSKGEILLGEAIFLSRPMLFTARIVWESEGSVLVAGGTVFGHIIVWRYHHHQHHRSGASELLFNLTGFEGSIFGVDMSSLMRLSNGSAVRFLIGCSDDRTIRVWDITERGDSSGEGNRGAHIVQDIDTGFGGNFGITEDDTGNSSGARDGMASIAVVAMGHASRIWGVKFAPSSGIDTLAVYSFGEDAVTSRWLLKLAKRSTEVDGELSPRRLLSGKLSHDKSYSLHHGKHLWSNAILIEGNSVSIATGGADSQISLIKESIAQVSSNSSTTLDVQGILQSIGPGASLASAKEIIGRYDFLTHDQILVTTSQGRLLLGSLSGGGDNSPPRWQEIAVEEDIAGEIKSCYVLKTIGDGSALLGATSGKMLLFQLFTKKIHLVATLPGKIVDVNRLSAPAEEENTVGVLIFLLGQADSHYLTMHLASGSLSHHEKITGLDSRFVATSAAMVSGMIVMGSRHGWLSMLKRDTSGDFRPVLNLATRSFDSITAIVPLPPKSSAQQDTCPYILVTSKDGKYRIYEIKENDNTLRLQLCHETSPPFGPVITSAWFTNSNGSSAGPELMLCGFRSKSFVVWNESRKEEVASIDCGGAHRTFQFAFDEEDAGRYRLAFTKTSKLSIHSFDRPVHRSLRTGVHGREIKALSSNGRYIASGAEDTSIRIWKHHHHNGEQSSGAAELICVATMKAHVTGIQRLAWFEEDYLFSSAGNEEFFVWRVRELQESAYGGLAVFRESEFTDKSADGDLRIMDFDVCRSNDHENGSVIIITMVLSNSTIKTYRYTCSHDGNARNDNRSAGGRFELVAQGSYVGACLTQVRHLDVREDVLAVLVASTDGHVTLWHAGSDEETQQRARTFVLAQAAQLHQNSIKSLDMLPTGEGNLILTGGDDNGVGIALVARTSDTSRTWRVSSRGIVRRGHAAAVTGVVLVRQGRQGIYGISVGNDQMVKVWRITRDEDRRMTLLAEAGTGIADAGDLVLVDRRNTDDESTSKSSNSHDGSTSPTKRSTQTATLMIGGVGMETWKVSLVE